MIACVVAVASIATGHPGVDAQLYQEPSYVSGEMGRVPIAVGRRVATVAVVAVSSQLMVKSA